MHLLVGNSLTRHDFHGKGHDTFVKIAPALQQAVSVAVNQKMTWKLPGALTQISGGTAKAEMRVREGVRVVKPVDFTHFKKMSHAWVNRENLLHLLSCQPN